MRNSGTSVRGERMKLGRTALCLLSIFGGVLQVYPGVRGTDTGRSWLLAGLPPSAGTALAMLLWATAMLGLIAAGFGVRGVPPFSRRPRKIGLAALGASAILLVLFWGPLTWVVALIDLVVLVALWPLSEPAASPPAGKFLRVVAVATLVYLAVTLLLRPWHMHWGATDDEVVARLPGDELVAEPGYQITRAITIQKPVSEVWPWIAQIGQDRSGFYSYDILERMVGFDVRNVHQIKPEWQQRAPGDLVRAAPPNGVFGPKFGWRVAAFEPNHALVLSSPIFNWVFVLRPIDERSTRLVVRLRADATPGPANFAKTVGEFMATGTAHFIMERKMLLTIKLLAESGPPPG
jgi:hypothetical protein